MTTKKKISFVFVTHLGYNLRMKKSLKEYHRSIRFPRYQAEGIQEIADKWGTDFSDVVRFAIQIFLDGDFEIKGKRREK